MFNRLTLPLSDVEKTSSSTKIRTFRWALNSMGNTSITFVASHVPAGGVEQIWRDLAQGFQTHGHSVQLLALRQVAAAGNGDQSSESWVTIQKQSRKSPFAAPYLLWALVEYFKRNKPDVLISAMPAANVFVPLALKLAGASTKVIITHHSPVNTYNQILNAVDSFVGSFDMISSIVSVSDAVKASLISKPERYLKKTTRIYNALPPYIEAHIAGLKHLPIGEKPRRRKIIATGRLAKQKNYPLLVRAAAYLDDVQIDIVGTGPDEAELRALADKLNVTEKIRFRGQLDRLKTLELLSEADIFVQPSLFEGHSLGLIEAAKLDMPLVVSTSPVQVEAITAPDGTKCGIAVDPHDPQEFARELRRLMDEPAYHAEWSKRATFLAGFSHFDVMYKAYETLLEAK